MQALQGYSMGAVDFILAPVVSEILRSKVGVFLELHERTAEVREHARRLLRQTRQLQSLTRASLKIHSAPSIDETLQLAADSAREIIGAPHAAALAVINHSGIRQEHLVLSPARRVTSLPRNFDPQKLDMHPTPCRRLTAGELRQVLPEDLATPRSTALAAPLAGRDGKALGVLLAIGDRQIDANGDDHDSLLVQLAQMAATAVENILFAEARESNRIKDEFLATLSHELRTPLSSVLGWAQMLKTKLLDPVETDEAVDIIERNAQMQCKMIEDLLDVSRIITGKMQLNLHRIHLAPVVLAAVDVVLPAARARGIEIDVAPFDEAADLVQGDADRLQQVFWNLLSNAVKFTHGRIDLRLDCDDARVRVLVRDDGEGIEPQFLPHVFDRFRQADSSKSRTHGGLGIGLAIVRHVVELHGGTVGVESAGVGRGTTFSVSLPLAPDESQDASEGGSLGARTAEVCGVDSNCEATLLH
jgi:signal transduction histidine kinase